MKRFRTVPIFLLAAVSLLLVLPACTVADPPALTVGTWSLSRNDFLAEMQKIAESGGFESRGQAPPQGGTTTVPKSYQTQDTAGVLNIYAQSEIMKQELARRNITVTPDDQKAFLEAMVQRAAAQGQQTTMQQLEGQLQQLDKLTRMQVDTQIAQQAIGRGLVPQAEVTEKARADYDANRDKLARTCLAFIHATAGTPPSRTNPRPPAATEADYAAASAKAQAAKAKVDGGTPFADVAKTDSDEPETAAKGGEAGCVQAEQLSQLPPEVGQLISTLPVNVVSDPVRIDGDGYYVFKVNSRQTPSFAEVQTEIEGQARQELGASRTREAITQAQRQADVTVDPLFGRWDKAAGQVVPPEGSAQPATTVPELDPQLLGGLNGAPGAGSPTAAPTPARAPSTPPPSSTSGTATSGTATSGTAAPGTAPAGAASASSTSRAPSTTAGGAPSSSTTR